MEVIRNFSLKDYNSFGIDVRANKFVAVTSMEELRELLEKSYSYDLMILGGGSNMLLTQDIQKTVVHIAIKGIRTIHESEKEVILEAAAGENWHDFVQFAIEKGFGGLENLSLIPGNVGTSPIQNIGAYGVELKDSFVSCRAINVQTLQEKEFTYAECNFGYRNSVFKNEYKGLYIITSVRFRLTKVEHELKLDYGAIRSELEQSGIENPGIKDVSNAVIAIRESKLPNPKEIGNSGSFFKNPVISMDQFKKLQDKFPAIPSYQISDNEVKVPAGWLIDQAGLKGHRDGDAGIHHKQALVLVNYGEATGREILMLAKMVQDKVAQKFGIHLEAEVNIIE